MEELYKAAGGKPLPKLAELTDDEKQKRLELLRNQAAELLEEEGRKET